MNNYIPYLLAFRLIELLAASGIVFLVSRCWDAGRDSAIVRFVRHRHRIWFALILFFLPMILGRMMFLRMSLRLAPSYGMISPGLVVGAMFNLFHGAIYGMVGCLLAAPATVEGGFRHWLALGIAAISIFLLSGMPIPGGVFRVFSAGYVPEMLAALVVLTFVAARAFPGKKSEVSHEGVESRKSKSPALALVLAFLPSAMILTMIPFARNTNLSAALCVACCGISVVCCFTSAFMLFRHGTVLAIFGGVLFLLLNAVVSFFFGCGAVLSQMKF